MSVEQIIEKARSILAKYASIDVRKFVVLCFVKAFSSNCIVEASKVMPRSTAAYLLNSLIKDNFVKREDNKLEVVLDLKQLIAELNELVELVEKLR